MTKQVIAGLLWSYFAWYGWSMYAAFQGLNPLWGPVIALAGVSVVLAVRIRRAWAKRDPAASGLLGPQHSPELA